MARSDDAWSEVGDQFKKLGSLFKQHYEARGTEDDPLATEGEIKAAARSVGKSVEAAFGAVGDSAKDPEVQEGARSAAASFFDAIGATFSEIGDEISSGREDEAPAEPEASSAAPEATEAEAPPVAEASDVDEPPADGDSD